MIRKKNNMKTEEKMILDNIPLIYKTIKDLHIRYSTNDEFQEYYDAGLDGLIAAVRSYDSSKAKISTWCILHIKNKMLRLITIKNQKKHKNDFGKDVSLNYIVDDCDYIAEFGDFIPDPNANVELEVEKKIEVERLLTAVNQLENDKDKLVIKMYYGLEEYEPRTYDAIAKYLNVSKEMIRVILNRARRRLKRYLEKNDGEKYYKGEDKK